MVLRSFVFFFSVVLTAQKLVDANASRIEQHSEQKELEQPPAVLLTPAMVESWTQEWQRKLGLTDWVIHSQIVHPRDLPRSAVAHIHWLLHSKRATIRLLHPDHSQLPKSEVVRDAELSVVHELVHLSLAVLRLDPANDKTEEVVVKNLSAALMSLKYPPAKPIPQTLAQK